MKSGKLGKTVSGVEAAPQTSFYLHASLLCFSLSMVHPNVKTWSWLSSPSTVNCSNRFCPMERLLWTVFEFTITGRYGTFFNWRGTLRLEYYVNKQNMCYWLADNLNWQITKSLHSEWLTVWCVISLYHIIRPLFLRIKQLHC